MALRPCKELTVPLYRVQVVICSSAAAADKRFGKGFLYKNFTAQVSTIEDSNTGIDFIVITFADPDAYNAECLTHECVHAAWRILELVGVTVSADNQEPLAYLAGWLSREVNNFMMDHIEAQKSNSE
ncbi:hypothetical protein EC843_101686 [Buttiauxella sp. JUb87]|uniref:hypothetical protein n=1 Tax=Buttiauxella sp. JUb87 TaxID=2485129 RepID=UPI00105C2D80|nr:hypothetical protein [Buttiauxella sp. JUb87]TDN54640.1 hypothetical protein EC843_101686 [Buttiauxella sp. JUb87]